MRLFFALWPNEATRAALDRVAADLHPIWGGRRMQSQTLHITLAFLGDTPNTRLDALRELAATITGEAFTLKLDRPGCWQHNRIGWLGVQDTPPTLTQLVANLRWALHQSGFTIDDQRYVPHVTLIRNAHCGPAPSCQPVTWRAQNFVLLASRKQRQGYDVLGAWPLSANPGIPGRA